MAKLFSEEWGESSQQFDLVLFLDGDEGDRKAVESNVANFLESWKRPKWHIVACEM
jgi:hypothetical protein